LISKIILAEQVISRTEHLKERHLAMSGLEMNEILELR
jgi:hypothetical protein